MVPTSHDDLKNLKGILKLSQVVNLNYAFSRGKQILNHHPSVPACPVKRVHRIKYIDNGPKAIHMREVLGLVHSDDLNLGDCNPVVSVVPLNLNSNLLDKKDELKLKRGSYRVRRRFLNDHYDVELSSDVGWNYLKRNSPALLVRSAEKSTLVSKYEQHCGTDIPLADCKPTRAKVITNEKRSCQNDVIISEASLRKYNISPEDARKLIIKATGCSVEIEALKGKIPLAAD
ncbi:uncharacterized protein LOC141855097 [Brevipalpus obovatus]|uniref:uncharacterized protein LOC141855097 n=1 Tax=Brevipalpus obovatus TaxID=246614 RepID=UPI003D9E9051